ncbi:MAG TPA: SpoIID/LytB domain-containing protein, partial [bacterium]|nr:SpoIID/LytB domain-containing protein [bacterium]
MTAMLRAGLAIILLPAAAWAAVNPYYSDRPEKAIKYYSGIVKKDPSNRAAFMNLASVYKEFGENEKAAEAYRAAVALNEKELRPRFELAKLYYFTGAYNYAEEELKHLIRRNLVNWELMYWHGCILLRMGKVNEAEEAFKKSLELDARKVVTYIKLAELNKIKGDIDAAIENYKEALKRDRTYTELNRRIAALYEEKKDKLNAFNYWRTVNDIDSKDVEAREKMQFFASSVPQVQQQIKSFLDDKKQRRDEYVPPDKRSVEDAGAIDIIRVGIVAGAEYIYFKCGGDFLVKDEKGKEILRGEKFKEYYIYLTEDKKQGIIGSGDNKIIFKKEIEIITPVKEATTSIYNVRYGEGFFFSERVDTTYRGDFRVVLNRKVFDLINLVNVEEYLYGVLPSEMPVGWNEEALKAQAVAARTYTFKHLGRHRKDGYDLCAQQHCAVYRGLHGENEKTNRIVNQTRGEVLYGSNYKLLDTFYSHSCGGHTMDVYEVWGMRKIGSLEGVYDGKKASTWNFPLEPVYLEEWVRSLPDVYCKATGNNE